MNIFDQQAYADGSTGGRDVKWALAELGIDSVWDAFVVVRGEHDGGECDRQGVAHGGVRTCSALWTREDGVIGEANEAEDCGRCRERVENAVRTDVAPARWVCVRELGEDAARSEIVSDCPDRSFASVMFIVSLLVSLLVSLRSESS